jgi:hypothetical protein
MTWLLIIIPVLCILYTVYNVIILTKDKRFKK